MAPIPENKEKRSSKTLSKGQTQYSCCQKKLTIHDEMILSSKARRKSSAKKVRASQVGLPEPTDVMKAPSVLVASQRNSQAPTASDLDAIVSSQGYLFISSQNQTTKFD